MISTKTKGNHYKDFLVYVKIKEGFIIIRTNKISKSPLSYWIMAFILIILVTLPVLSLSRRYFVDDNIDGPQKLIDCCTDGVLGMPNSTCFKTATIEYCRSQGGAVQDCIPEQNPSASSFSIQNFPPGSRNISLAKVNFSDPFIIKLISDVNNSYIWNRTYVKDTYDCDDFAGDMELYLSALGYNATFTAIQIYNNSRTIVVHALNDIHLPDGTIIFLEPQNNMSKNPRSLFKNLDLNGDGNVTVWFGTPWLWGLHPTEPETKNVSAQVGVYDSRADAENKFVITD